MARYLLDTNALSYLIDTASPGHTAVHDRLASLPDTDEVALSVLSLYELHHWFAYDPAALAAAQEIIASFPVLPLPEAGAAVFGALMRDLRPAIGRSDIQRRAVDGMIAVTTLAHGAVLVSNDALFGRLAKLNPALRVTDWTTA
jgi:predicted nucleic acid-binding protein